MDVSRGVQALHRLRHRHDEARHLAARKRQQKRLQILHHVVGAAAAHAASVERRQVARLEKAYGVHLREETLAYAILRSFHEKLERALAARARVYHPVHLGGKTFAKKGLHAPFAHHRAKREPAVRHGSAGRPGIEPRF